MSDVPFVADGPPHPDNPNLLRFTKFDGYVKSFKVDPMTGELVFTLAVRPDEKYAAFKLTDHMLLKYQFDVYKAPKISRRRVVVQTPDDDDEDADTDDEGLDL